ncbi:hypothetical protein [Qipengyuania oceanensis]|uniref:Uncharacterized protein n=1 Tax=Qipengyuania oceanensis TaxID=1463597 RepID=A0A844YE79_9SPHN|nr:hypothetical protein [Qipengyuania oceanensis]MXO62461.1 hypothetical protein [Qipengyuania oceanensis]
MSGPEKDPAASRFAIITLARLAGALCVVFGMPMVSGRIGDSPALGIALILVGLAGFFFLPKYLARRWRSPKA